MKNSSLVLIASRYQHICVYRWRDTLFVWSLRSHYAYVFEGVFAALFFLMEESSQLSLDKGYLDMLNIQHTPSAEDVLGSIYKLLTQTETYESYHEEESYLLKNKAFQTTYPVKALHCSLGKHHFQLSCDEELEPIIYPVFSYLQTKNSNYHTSYYFSIKHEDDSYNFYVNDEKKESIEEVYNILPVLMDVIRITIYQNDDYVVSLHAAALRHNETTFILPGISGAGKSTLSTFLMHNEFQLYSDEVTVVDREYSIKPLPLPTTIKEGSWHIVKNIVEDFYTLAIHRRFDAQRIKFVTPNSITQDVAPALNAVIVFPKYQSDTQTIITPITLTQALQLIQEAEYQLQKPDDFTTVKQFLTFLLSCRLYTLTYSNLDDAMNTLIKLET